MDRRLDARGAMEGTENRPGMVLSSKKAARADAQKLPKGYRP